MLTKKSKPKPKKKIKDDVPVKRVKVGHPTKYNSTIPAKVKKLAALGARDKDIAKSLGISEATLNTWKQKYPELLESLRAGKKGVDQHVVCSLLKSALGYSVTETKRFYKPLFSSNGDPVIGNDGKQVKALIREEVTEKEVPASYTAQIFWLKNRRPDQWRVGVQEDFEKSKGEITDLFNQWKGADVRTT